MRLDVTRNQYANCGTTCRSCFASSALSRAGRFLCCVAVFCGVGAMGGRRVSAQGAAPDRPADVDRRTPPGAVPETARPPSAARPLLEEEALAAGLGWLVRHQDAGGAWDPAGFCPRGRCDGPGRDDYALALTGLALQAVACAPPPALVSGPGAAALDAARARAAAFLARELPLHLETSNTWHFYNLAIGAAGLAAELERRDDAEAREALKEVVKKILASQNADGGWGSPTAGLASDSSGTGWCLDALAAARRARIDVPDSAPARAREWYDSVTAGDGRVGYRQRGDGGFVFRNIEERYASHEIMTATRFAALPVAPDAAGKRAVERMAKLLGGDLPSAAPESADYLYWHQGTRALLSGGGAPALTSRLWLRSLRRAVLRKQVRLRGDCADGSWAPDDRWSSMGGRVYATALNAFTLERALPALREAAAREPDRATGAARERLRGLIGQLGSVSLSEREAASRSLLEAGDAAEPLLREALKADDAEVRARARMILDRLGLEDRDGSR